MPYIPPKYRQWLNNQAERRASIPYPDEAVVYKRQSNNSYWESRRQNALDHVPSSYSINFPVDRIFGGITRIHYNIFHNYIVFSILFQITSAV